VNTRISGSSKTEPLGVAIAIAAVGTALVIAALAANQYWLDRHFLPSFFMPRRWYVLIETAVRGAFLVAGVLLVLGRSRAARRLTVAPAATVRIVAAVTLAIAAGEVVLRSIHLRPTEWLLAEEEPRRQPDGQLGWVLAPARAGRSRVNGRMIEYAIDPSGYRARHVDDGVDFDRATIVFAGESVMFGEGLTWDESIPAQVGAMLDVQSANLAVHGYSTDQMYMRLNRELPRFRHPLAVVSIFMTELFGRNLDADRPHLAPGLSWRPAEHASRLMSLAALLVPYRRTETVERGIGVTREVLLAIAHLVRARGAAPLVILPQFGPEDRAQLGIRERVLAEDVPSVVIALDPDWRLPWDRHPNARAARAIAAAIASRLPRP
jgi:hypothetical protein